MSGLEAVEEALGSPDRHQVVVVAERLEAFQTDTPARIAASNTLTLPAPDVFVPGRAHASPTGDPVLLDYAGGRPHSRGRGLCVHSSCCSPEPASSKVPTPRLTGHTVDSLTGWERGTSQNAGSRMADI